MAVSFERSTFNAAPQALARAWHDLRIAIAFLTRLPVAPPLPASGEEDGGPPAATVSERGYLAGAALYFPLIGALIGGFGGLALLLCFDMGLHPLACALIGLAVIALITGALHEDGLADFCDGLGGGRDRAHSLEIMHDSAIGSFGVLALIFSVAIKAAILSGLFSPYDAATSLVAAGAISRAPLPTMLRWLTSARDDGLAVNAGRPARLQVIGAWMIAATVGLLTVEWWVAPILLAAVSLAAAVVALLARRNLGGITGDVLGAAQVIGEIAVLIAIAATE